MRTLVVPMLLLSMVAATLAPLGCGSSRQPGSEAPELTGTVGVRLTLADGATLNTLNYTIAGPTMTSGSIDVSMTASIHAVIGGLAAGPGYSLALSGTTNMGDACAGSAGMFAVNANAVTPVAIVLTCHQAVRTGSVSVNGQVDVCPALQSINAIPGSTFVGNNIALNAAAGPDESAIGFPLAYTWTGVASSDMAGNATFHCSAPGQFPVSVSVSNGDPACMPAPGTSILITLECDSQCLSLGEPCAQGSDCCSGACAGGVCSFPACVSDGQSCTGNASCCSGVCTAGACAPLNTTCKTLGNACAGNSDCCSARCANGTCSPASFCGQQGDACSANADCCSGACAMASGKLYGTCGPAPVGNTSCTLVDGTVCGGTDGSAPVCGGGCCGGTCAPYGPTGVLVCLPSTGCHAAGDICARDSDCCGSVGLPGISGTPVACHISPGNVLGVCGNQQGCKPDGDICKLTTQSCNATCDCCTGNCLTQNTCNPDDLGVPRCTGSTCVMPGGSCASSADCCNGLPCVPNPAGTTPAYVCLQGATCAPAGGACSSDADCCVGEWCLTARGSTAGTCTKTKIPAGGAACALYGQSCASSTDCCAGVSCLDHAGAACSAGGAGCRCTSPRG
jgi:hypothetical protein